MYAPGLISEVEAQSWGHKLGKGGMGVTTCSGGSSPAMGWLAQD